MKKYFRTQEENQSETQLQSQKGKKMKYIRTKDGRIFKIIESDDETGTFVITNYKETCSLSYYSEYILKQADTIEELCDWFLTIVNGRIHTYGVDFEYAKSHLFLFEKCESVEIKSAIETNKGLIYVAKMNEKGEMELL